MGYINHNEATSLEFSVRKVFNCNRFAVMGVADADYLETNPMAAVLVVFAPLYKEQEKIPEIDDFVDKYSTIFDYPDEYKYDEETVKNFINKFDELISKYIK